MMNQPVKVIIVEDDLELRESLVDYLSMTGFDVEGVGCGIDFYNILKNRKFDVAIIDIGLPDQSGYVLAEYARRNTGMGLIIVSANDTIDSRISSYESGSDLFLAKPLICRELAAAIISIASRKTETGASGKVSVVAAGWVLERVQWRLVSPKGVATSLTVKELQLLDILTSLPGEVIPREKLLQQLYTESSEYNNRALDNLVRRLRRKIEEQTGTEPPITTAYAKGYSFNAAISQS